MSRTCHSGTCHVMLQAMHSAQSEAAVHFVAHCDTCSPARKGSAQLFIFPSLEMANDYDLDATELLETYGWALHSIPSDPPDFWSVSRLSHEIYYHR